MSDLQPFGTFPTPYGVSVPVYQPKVIDPADPDQVLFSMDATAICAGIHDKAERARFAADAKRIGAAPVFEDYGGHPLPKVALTRPRDPAYPRVAGLIADMPVEAWTTGIMDRHRWCDRADFLTDIIGSNMATIEGHNDLAAEFYPLALSVVLTASLEHLCESEIDCIEAAAFYVLTEHEEWRTAALKWLTPFRETWFRDWRDAKPDYIAFASPIAKAFALPAWLHGQRGAA